MKKELEKQKSQAFGKKSEENKKITPIKKDKSLKKTSLSKKLVNDLRDLINHTRNEVARSVNSALVILYWQIGRRIRQDILKERRAGYGEQVVPLLSEQLVKEFGNGFAEKNLHRMIQFAEVFPDLEIVVTLSRQLTWSHFISIIPLKEDLQRNFYAEMSRIERWSVRTLRKKIGGMLFERTALSKKPTELAKQELVGLREEDKLTPDLIFRDPYFLDFLGLKDTYSEKDLESAILRELETFILELGVGFTFVARQKRITVGNEDYYLDLLFYHRKLKRLVAIELKLDIFKPSDKGQMELYLRWLEKYEQEKGEESPIGLILCAGKSEEQIELLQLHKSSIRVSAYMTELPPRELLQKKLHDAIKLAQIKLESKDTKSNKT